MRLKLKLRVFLAGHSVAMVTHCVTKILPTCSLVIEQDCSINTSGYMKVHIFELRRMLPVGLIAQLVEHCTGIAEVMGSNPIQA